MESLSTAKNDESADSSPLFVDLDGTLIASDILHESLLLLIKRSPRHILSLPFWLLDGRAVLKRRLVELDSVPNVSILPYREDVVEFLCAEKEKGRSLILATASDEVIANQVAEHLGIFDFVLGSDGFTNLKATRKCEAIEKLCAEHDWDSFGYIGDSAADRPIWKKAKERYVVLSKAAIASRRRDHWTPNQVFGVHEPVARGIFKSLRVYQWSKNVLVLCPLFLAHQWQNTDKLFQVMLAFVCFCCCASATYLINDLFDLESDRQHPTKRRRPFASGRLPLVYGPLVAAVLLAASVLIATMGLGGKFFLMLLVYFVMSLTYSLWFKRKLIVDVLVLAGLYGLRLLAGGYAVDVRISEWTFAFSGFIFTSLAFLKRYTELLRMESQNVDRTHGRGYELSDISLIETVGLTNGFLSVLVMALFINSEEVAQHYEDRSFLWFVCPLLAYWITRMWFFAKRNRMTDDPIVFAFTDRTSILVLLTATSAVLLATIGWGIAW